MEFLLPADNMDCSSLRMRGITEFHFILEPIIPRWVEEIAREITA